MPKKCLFFGRNLTGIVVNKNVSRGPGLGTKKGRTARMTTAEISTLPKGLLAPLMQSDVPIVVADASKDDMPLALCNRAFCDMSGYDQDEMIGTNCRFMQPSSGIGPVKERMRAFLDDDAETQAEFVLPNERKDGSRFLNLLHLTKMTHPDRPPLMMGSQFDITTQDADALRKYKTAFLRDMQLIQKAVSKDGWAMDTPNESIAESLERISQSELSDQ